MPDRNSMSHLPLARKQHRVVTEAVEHWRESGVVDDQMAGRLRESISIAPFDWERTARYAFITAIVCLVIALAAFVADELVMEVLKRFLAAPAAAQSLLFVAVAGLLFWKGLRLRRRHPHRIYGNEAVFFLGVLALAAGVFFLGVALDGSSDRYSTLFLIASISYACLGLAFPSKLVWVFGLLSFGAWMGTETGYLSGRGMYFLGMNYPLRFAVLGLMLSLLGMIGQRRGDDRGTSESTTLVSRLRFMSPQTKVIGLLHLFIALWLMSIFGNYGDMTEWYNAPRHELLHWSVIFGAVAVAAIWYGLKHDDGVLRGFGLTFLFINLYTRFFEYFWSSTHSGIFFGVLALSFWYLGRRAETIWHMGETELKTAITNRAGNRPRG